MPVKNFTPQTVHSGSGKGGRGRVFHTVYHTVKRYTVKQILFLIQVRWPSHSRLSISRRYLLHQDLEVMVIMADREQGVDNVVQY